MVYFFVAIAMLQCDQHKRSDSSFSLPLFLCILSLVLFFISFAGFNQVQFFTQDDQILGECFAAGSWPAMGLCGLLQGEYLYLELSLII